VNVTLSQQFPPALCILAFCQLKRASQVSRQWTRRWQSQFGRRS